MTPHRAFNIGLACAIALALAVIGPGLDGDAHPSAAQTAQEVREALAAGSPEGHERLLALCRMKHGDLADVRWTPAGPTCGHLGRATAPTTTTAQR